MSEYIPLGKACKYSSEKIKLDELTLGSYITTDNILQNKQGVTIATNLPPQGNSFPKYNAGNVLVGNIRPYLKKIWFADNDGGCSADVLVFDVKKGFYPKFVYYAMFQDDFFVHAMKGSKGTKMPRGDKNQIMEYQIPDIDFNSQKQIASVLSALDSKIALNNRINAELEAMAKTVYDYWFVQFDFPNIEGKPYKSSGGKMVWSEELKREIPEGWEVKNLFDAMDVQYGFPFSTEMFSDNKNGKPIVRIRDILENTISTYSTEDVDEKYMLIQNDLLIGMDGNFHLNFWDKTGAYLNQRSVRLRSKEESIVSNLQAYFELKPHIKAREKNTSRTTVGHLSDKDLKGLYLINAVENKYFKPKVHFDSLLNMIISNRLQNQQLSSLRDWLLPMLMNGQVRVDAQAYAEMEEGDGLMAAEESVGYDINNSIKSDKKWTIGNRTILAGYIIKRFNCKGFGRVMLMKLLFLVEYICKIDFESHYVVNVAGPYDDLIREIELKLRTYKLFNAKQEKFGNQVSYEDMGGSDIVESLFTESFCQEADQINSILDKFLNSKWDQCEIVATLYAVWNNRILNNYQINDMVLKQDFLNWDPQKVKYENRLDDMLVWMRKNDIVPIGWGKLIEK